MGLILNKTMTGVTSTISVTGVTGNYIETGYTETIYFNTGYTETIYNTGYTYSQTINTIGLINLEYLDEYGGSHDNPYLVIDSVFIDKLRKFIKIYVSIYKSTNARSNLKKPIFEEHYTISNPGLFDEYFSSNDQSDVNVFKKSYKYIETIYYNWKSDI